MGPNKNAPAQPGLERVIGVRALAANAVNMTVGAGIFALPAVVAAQLGPSAFFAYVVCAIAMGLVLLCFAESGSRVHESGGACAYVEAAFGPGLLPTDKPIRLLTRWFVAISLLGLAAASCWML